MCYSSNCQNATKYSITWDHGSIASNYFQRRLNLTTVTILCGWCIKTHIDTTLKRHTDNLLSVNDTVKFMFIVQITMYHYDIYVKVAYDNFNNKRRWRWWWWWWWWWCKRRRCRTTRESFRCRHATLTTASKYNSLRCFLSFSLCNTKQRFRTTIKVYPQLKKIPHSLCPSVVMFTEHSRPLSRM